MDLKPIANYKDLYILGRPIITELGLIYHPLVVDFPEIYTFDFVMKLNRIEMRILLEDLTEEMPLGQVYLDLLKDMDLVDFIKILSSQDDSDGLFAGIHKQLENMFELFFREKGKFDLIKNDKELQVYLSIFRDLCSKKYKTPAPTKALRKRDKVQEKLREDSGESVSFESMITSVELATGEDPTQMTIYRFYKIFDRLSIFKDHDRSVLYSVMSSEVKVVNWYQSTEVEEEKKTKYLTEQELEKAKENKGLSTDL